ncbi:hypothetical protein AAMO2058_000632000 [Amorphochlora amoebiformis]
MPVSRGTSKKRVRGPAILLDNDSKYYFTGVDDSPKVVLCSIVNGVKSLITKNITRMTFTASRQTKDKKDKIYNLYTITDDLQEMFSLPIVNFVFDEAADGKSNKYALEAPIVRKKEFMGIIIATLKNRSQTQGSNTGPMDKKLKTIEISDAATDDNATEDTTTEIQGEDLGDGIFHFF